MSNEGKKDSAPDGYITLDKLEQDLRKIPGMAELIDKEHAKLKRRRRQPRTRRKG